MTTLHDHPLASRSAAEADPVPPARRRRRSQHIGRIGTALCGGALAASVLAVFGLLLLLAWHGGGHFWPRRLWRLELTDGTVLAGEVVERQPVAAADGSASHRIKLATGNRDFGTPEFRWVDEARIASMELAEDLLRIERLEWGVCFASIVELPADAAADDAPSRLAALRRAIAEKQQQGERLHAREVGELGDLVHDWNAAKLERRRLERRGQVNPTLDRQIDELHGAMTRLSEQLASQRQALDSDEVLVAAVDGTRRRLPISSLDRVIQPNRLDFFDELGLYLRRWWVFLSDEPRESNTEGGVFPAIFGTVLMVFLMTFMVTPFGVLAALYLREYAREGWVVQLVRIAVNNLAGVPSIVFGVFGLGFFVYLVGGTIDEWFYADSLPTGTFGTGGILWAALTLALLTVPVVIVATEEGLAAVPRSLREGSMALGATKWETLRSVVLPAATPGILTGVILAVARAAGEVAPLMLVGVVKMAPELPLDDRFPFLHLERKFMHLGFHIYDVGLQSPNIEASKPLVYATALLLVSLVAGMNLLAIGIRNHLRRRHVQHAV